MSLFIYFSLLCNFPRATPGVSHSTTIHHLNQQHLLNNNVIWGAPPQGVAGTSQSSNRTPSKAKKKLKKRFFNKLQKKLQGLSNKASDTSKMISTGTNIKSSEVYSEHTPPGRPDSGSDSGSDSSMSGSWSSVSGSSTNSSFSTSSKKNNQRLAPSPVLSDDYASMSQTSKHSQSKLSHDPTNNSPIKFSNENNILAHSIIASKDPLHAIKNLSITPNPFKRSPQLLDSDNGQVSVQRPLHNVNDYHDSVTEAIQDILSKSPSHHSLNSVSSDQSEHIQIPIRRDQPSQHNLEIAPILRSTNIRMVEVLPNPKPMLPPMPTRLKPKPLDVSKEISHKPTAMQTEILPSQTEVPPRNKKMTPKQTELPPMQKKIQADFPPKEKTKQTGSPPKQMEIPPKSTEIPPKITDISPKPTSKQIELPKPTIIPIEVPPKQTNVLPMQTEILPIKSLMPPDKPTEIPLKPQSPFKHTEISKDMLLEQTEFLTKEKVPPKPPRKSTQIPLKPKPFFKPAAFPQKHIRVALKETESSLNPRPQLPFKPETIPQTPIEVPLKQKVTSPKPIQTPRQPIRPPQKPTENPNISFKPEIIPQAPTKFTLKQKETLPKPIPIPRQRPHKPTKNQKSILQPAHISIQVPHKQTQLTKPPLSDKQKLFTKEYPSTEPTNASIQFSKKKNTEVYFSSNKSSGIPPNSKYKQQKDSGRVANMIKQIEQRALKTGTSYIDFLGVASPQDKTKRTKTRIPKYLIRRPRPFNPREVFHSHYTRHNRL